MNKSYRRALALAACLLLGGTYAGAVPAGFNVQGRLTDSNGVNRDGTYSMKFTIYDAPTGGVQKWTKTSAIAVHNGNFQTVLADVAGQPPLSDVFAGDSRYLEMQVLSGAGISAPEPPLVPRQQLVSVPYAFRAGGVKSAPSNTGSGSDGALVVSGNSTLPAGEYQLTSLTVNPGATLTVGGFAIIRCLGTVSLQGTIVVSAYQPGGTTTVGGAFGLDAGGNGSGIGAGGGAQSDNGGGGGGGNGGPGGHGYTGGGGGVAYPWRIQPFGSGGGAGQTTTTGSAGYGGGGGGGLVIVSKGAVSIGGSITANGDPGAGGSNGGGGGSGGTIAIFSETSINSSASIQARGGSGGSGKGGGGGGGHVLIVAPTTSVSPAPDVSGGSGISGGASGATGKVSILNEAPGYKAL
jgi:hypothetical protein